MNLFDLVILFIISLFMFSSYRVGFFEEIVTLISLITSTVSAYIFAPLLAPYLSFFSENYYVVIIIACIIIFTIVYLIFKLVRDGIFDFIEDTNLSPVDRFLGLILGMVKGVILVSLFIFILYKIDIKSVNHFLGKSLISNLFIEQIETKLKQI